MSWKSGQYGGKPEKRKRGISRQSMRRGRKRTAEKVYGSKPVRTDLGERAVKKDNKDYAESGKYSRDRWPDMPLSGDVSGADRNRRKKPGFGSPQVGKEHKQSIGCQRARKKAPLTRLYAMARQNRIVIQEVDRSVLDRHVRNSMRIKGVIAFAAAKEYADLDDMLDAAFASGAPPFVVLLDEITDSNNFGSILRSANAAGAHGVVIPKRRAVGLTACRVQGVCGRRRICARGKSHKPRPDHQIPQKERTYG
jgi:23S rRNA (guanosine2251-2'-O)-methyltransferase